MPQSSQAEDRLPNKANLDYLKKRAKQLLKLVRSNDRQALARLHDQLDRSVDDGQILQLKLSDAQLVVAREHGFASWPKLKAAVERGHGIEGRQAASGAPLKVPLLPLRDYIVFPGMSMPLYVGRSQSLCAIDAASDGKPIFLVVQRDGTIDDPESSDLYEIGTLAVVTRRVPSPTGLQVMVTGERRALCRHLDFTGPFASAEVVPLLSGNDEEPLAAQVDRARTIFVGVARALDLPAELDLALASANGASELSDVAAQHLSLGLEKRQELLELVHPGERLERAVQIFAKLGEEIETPRLGDYGGHYQLQPGFVVSFTEGDGSLIAESPWESAEVFSRGGDTFARRVDHVQDNDPSPVPLYIAMSRVRLTLGYKFIRDDDGKVVGVVRNDGFSTWPSGQKLADLGAADPAVRSTGSELRRYVGRYEIGDGFEANISLSGDQLSLDTHCLCARGNTEFFGERDPVLVRFKFSDSNDVIGMWVNGPRGRHQYWKVA